jgi:hypothetical protein
MAIIALIGGLGAGAYQVAYRNYALAASAGRIQAILRAARNTSLTTGAPSFVVIDPEARTASAHAFERVGAWSFEEDGAAETTALGTRGETNHGGTPVAGRVGKGLDFETAGAYYDCGALARYDLRAGILIEAWVRHGTMPVIKKPDGERGRATVRLTGGGREAARPEVKAMAIVEKDGAYFFGMTASGALEGGIGDHRARTPDGVVPPGRWVFVSLRYAAGALELSADGVPRPLRSPAAGGRQSLRAARKGRAAAEAGAAPEDAPPATAPVTPAPLTISSLLLPFPGVIDEVHLAGSVEPASYRWSDFEHVLGWKKVIHFDRDGHLDPRRHRESARLVLLELLEPDAVKKTTVAVNYNVTFDEWLATFEEPPPLRQSEEEAKVEAAFASLRKVAIEVDRLGVVK